MRSLVPPPGNSPRARWRAGASPRAGDSPRAGLMPRERLRSRARDRSRDRPRPGVASTAGGTSSAGAAPSLVVRVGSSIVPRLVLPWRNLLADRLVAMLACLLLTY